MGSEVVWETSFRCKITKSFMVIVNRCADTGNYSRTFGLIICNCLIINTICNLAGLEDLS